MIRIRSGEHLTLHQFCNDWITADTDDGRPVVVTPTTVRFTPEEIFELQTNPDPGTFWDEFEIHPDGDRLRKKRRRT